MTQFEATKAEMMLISKIADRAKAMFPKPDRPQGEWMTDIEAVHCNGCPLDLQKFINFEDFDFEHDVAGIYRHLDRETGKLKDLFSPRCHQ
jgi:hypothetical protein